MASIALASTLALSAFGPASNAPASMSSGAAPSVSSPDGSKAYVTDATKKELKIIDLKAMKVERTVKLDKAAVEMAVVTGTPESSHADH
ncbi:hypothetical protein [Neomicrococcus lactis]|uniref:hypothetical protein n=1 Tax=Neomicrococcus lactis TaxID=732241 RepID=UPI002300CE37|nr:hypothetical protein [Neomicrococcus lactis]